MTQGKTFKRDVLISGAPGTIGTAISELLAENGFVVHLVARRREQLESLSNKLKSQGREFEIYACEMDRPQEIDQVMEDFFARAVNPYALICNAGNFGTLGPFHQTEFINWRRSFDSNFFSHAQMIHSFVNGLLKKESLLEKEHTAKEESHAARIVVMSGGELGGTKSFENISSYSCAKAALTHFVEAIAPELIGRKITINAIFPGPVKSEMVARAMKETKEGLKKLHDELAQTSLRGGTSPLLSAQLIQLLLSEEMQGVTGRLLHARFDSSVLKERNLSKEKDLFRMRRIDEALFGRQSNDC